MIITLDGEEDEMKREFEALVESKLEELGDSAAFVFVSVLEVVALELCAGFLADTSVEVVL